MIRIIFLFVNLLIFNRYSYSNTHFIGENKPYPTPNALYLADVVENGDTILIDAVDYSGQDALAIWYADDLVIMGMGGRPHLIADGAYIQGKGIWVIKGKNNTIENIEFSGAKVPDKNGAGIRLDGIGLTLRYCYFHENENGLLTSNPYDGYILIEYCEFENGGFGDGFSHNLYIGHVASLTFRFNYSHHGKVGHCLKSRAQENYIFYNRIMDEEEGYSSRLIDLPNGGTAVVMGNLLMQGPLAENSNMVGFGPEGLSNDPPHQLYIVNNTFVNKRPNTGIYVFIKDGTDESHIYNNIFAGEGTMLNGNSGDIQSNILETDIASLYFEDEESYNYHLTENSPGIDQGMTGPELNGSPLIPEFEYVHPTNQESRDISNSIDIGAYEFPISSGLKSVKQDGIKLFPNPVENHLWVETSDISMLGIDVIDLQGQIIDIPSLIEKEKAKLNLSELNKGIYFIRITTHVQPPIVRPIIKL